MVPGLISKQEVIALSGSTEPDGSLDDSHEMDYPAFSETLARIAHYIGLNMLRRLRSARSSSQEVSGTDSTAASGTSRCCLGIKRVVPHSCKGPPCNIQPAFCPCIQL